MIVRRAVHGSCINSRRADASSAMCHDAALLSWPVQTRSNPLLASSSRVVARPGLGCWLGTFAEVRWTIRRQACAHGARIDGKGLGWIGRRRVDPMEVGEGTEACQVGEDVAQDGGFAEMEAHACRNAGRAFAARSDAASHAQSPSRPCPVAVQPCRHPAMSCPS